MPAPVNTTMRLARLIASAEDATLLLTTHSCWSIIIVIVVIMTLYCMNVTNMGQRLKRRVRVRVRVRQMRTKKDLAS